MKRLILLISLLLCVSAFGQGFEQKLEIRGFKGLNTVAGDFFVQPNESRFAFNIDFGENLGSLTKRLGYDSVSSISGMDSIIAIYPAYYSDGTEQLFIIADTNTQGFGAVYVTNKGSNNLDSLTKVWTFWSVLGYPSFTMIDDNVYIVNGYNRGIVYSNGIARSYPPRSPAEPYIIPLSDSGGLDGVYRYVFYISDTTQNSFSVDTTIDTTFYECVLYDKIGNCILWEESPDYGDSVHAIDTIIDTSLTSTSHLRQSSVSAPVRVSNGQVFITGFTPPNVDSVNNYSDPYDAGFRVTIARTKGDFLRLTESTPIYYLDNILFPDADSARGYTFRDSVSDSDIDSILSFDLAVDVSMKGKDSTGVVHTRYGACGFMSVDSLFTYSDSTDTASAFGIFHGIVDQNDTLGMAYFVTLIDTVTGIESDTGRGLYVFNDTSQFINSSKTFSQTISLPKVLSNDSGLVYNLYRANIEQVTYDSSYWEQIPDDNPWTRFIADRYDTLKNIGFQTYRWNYQLNPDTVVIRDLYLLAQLPTSDTIYTDSIRQDSLMTKRRYSKGTPPALLDNIFSYQGRLYGTFGSRLYRSGLLNGADTIQTWGQMDFQVFDGDDGDVGTVAFPTRTAIRFMKNRSNYNVYDDFGKTEVSGYWGCIAPQSLAKGLGGIYYLTGEGVVRESEGSQLERTVQLDLVSKQLDNFDNIDIKTRSRSYGFYHNHKYFLYIPSPIDTCYVYDERADAWSTWNLDIASAGLYGVDNQVSYLPGDTIYFIRPGGSVLYRYGTSEFDNYRSGSDSTAVQMLWYSPRLFPDGNKEKINAIGLYCNSSDAEDSLTADIRNEEGTNIGIFSFPALTQYYYESVDSCKTGYSLSLRVGSTPGINLETTVIDGLDIYFSIKGKAKRE